MSFCARRLCLAVLALLCVTPAFAGERYALIITGASGGEAYQQKYDRWRATFLATLRERFAYKPIACWCSPRPRAKACRRRRARTSNVCSPICGGD